MAKGIRPQGKKLSQGYVVFETDAIVAIATGFVKPSKNAKTGPMIQIWILVKEEDPIAAVRSGNDHKVCFTCPYRNQEILVHPYKRKPEITQVKVERKCYVGLEKAPLAVWKCWRAGGYPTLTDYSVFRGRPVRFGAYGEPTKIPFTIVKAIAQEAKLPHPVTGKPGLFTGYTHTWRNPLFQPYKEFFMASTSDADYAEAKSAGWRAFAVSETALQGAITCPASKEAGQRTQCFKCGLCAGNSRPAKNITIMAH